MGPPQLERYTDDPNPNFQFDGMRQGGPAAAPAGISPRHRSPVLVEDMAPNYVPSYHEN